MEGADNVPRRTSIVGIVAADEGCDDDGPEFRPPLPPEDRIWRHPAELRGLQAAPPADRGGGGRSPWTVGFVSVIGGVLLAGSLMFGVGGLGDEPSRIALEPIATLEKRDDGPDPDGRSGTDDPPASESVLALDISTGTEVRSGNALALRADGYLVTTATLVAGATDIRLTDDGGAQHAGRLVGVDALNDLAVVHVANVGLSAAALDPEAMAAAGASVRVLGASRGVAHPAWEASVLDASTRLVTDVVDLHGALRLAESLDASAAGAPVATDDGTIVGIATTSAVDGSTHVVPARTVLSVSEQLIAWGEARHGWMGIEGVTDEVNGALVRRVIDSSPADAAGLLAGDRIVAVDAAEITTMSDLVVAVRERPPGSEIALGVMRDGTTLTLPVTLTSIPTR